jgi:hypothetical protein
VENKPQALAALAKESLPEGAPLPQGQLVEVALHPVELNKFLLRQVRYRYSGTAQIVPFALPYWAQLGPSDWRTATVGGGGVELYWDSADTRLTVSIPQSRQDVELLLTDVHQEARNPKDTVSRTNIVIATENEDRQERLRSKKAWNRLPRKIAVPVMGTVKEFELGSTEDAAKQLLPKSDQVVTISKDEGDGSHVLIATNASTAATGKDYVARQCVMRFQNSAKGSQLTWIRVRYEGDSGASRTWAQDILKNWQKTGGIMALRPYRLASLYGDEGKAPQYTYWRDDSTEVSFVYDQMGSVEVTLAARPDDDPRVAPTANVPAFLWRGPYPNLALDMSVNELHRLGLRPTERSVNEFSMSPGPNEPWDTIVVTTDGRNRVSSIVARYRPEAGKTRPSTKEIQDALVSQWGRQIRLIGWPNRTTRTTDPSNALNTFTWLDATTRYRLSWAQDESGRPVLLSEWRDVASLQASLAAAGTGPTSVAPPGSGLPTSGSKGY